MSGSAVGGFARIVKSPKPANPLYQLGNAPFRYL